MRFLDTNVLVYAVDCRNPAKHRAARAIVVEALGDRRSVLSVQVLNEFANVAMKKLQMDEDEVQGYLAIFRRINILSPTPETTMRALVLKKRYGLQFYDSLLLAAAEAAGCTEILTEDLADGQNYGSVKARNPFKGM